MGTWNQPSGYGNNIAPGGGRDVNPHPLKCGQVAVLVLAVAAKRNARDAIGAGGTPAMMGRYTRECRLSHNAGRLDATHPGRAGVTRGSFRNEKHSDREHQSECRVMPIWYCRDSSRPDALNGGVRHPRMSHVCLFLHAASAAFSASALELRRAYYPPYPLAWPIN